MGTIRVENIRYYERYLLLSSIPFLLFLTIYGIMMFTENNLMISFMMGSIILFSLIIHLHLCKINNQCDEYVLPVVLVLSGISVIFVFSLRPDLILRHYFSIMGGLGLYFFILSYSKHLDFKRVVIPLSISGILILALTIVFGREYGGSKRWLDLWILTVQPGVFMYIIFPLFASYMIARRSVKGINTSFIIASYWLVLALIFIYSRDFGSLFIITCIYVALLYINSQNMLHLLGGGVLSIGMLVMGYFKFSYIRIRINNWLYPFEDIFGYAQQMAYSYFVMGEGGLMGSGIGTAYHIPASHNDFIFSIFHGEMGFLSAVALIILYTVLIYRGFRIALQSNTREYMLLSVGITVSIGIQSFILISGSTGFMPMSGVILPFLSFGGNGMIASFLAIALLLKIGDNREAIKL